MRPHGNACTRHPRTPANITRDGRCRRCRATAQERYRIRCQAALKRLTEMGIAI